MVGCSNPHFGHFDLPMGEAMGHLPSPWAPIPSIGIYLAIHTKEFPSLASHHVFFTFFLGVVKISIFGHFHPFPTPFRALTTHWATPRGHIWVPTPSTTPPPCRNFRQARSERLVDFWYRSITTGCFLSNVMY